MKQLILPLLVIIFLCDSIETNAQWIDIYPGVVDTPANAQGHAACNFFDVNTGYSMSVKGVEKTTDGGASWQLLDTAWASDLYNRRMFFVNRDTGFVFQDK